MGYSIKNISEINTFDFSLCDGYSNANTVRRSTDGLLFIVEGSSFTDFTHEEILIEVAKSEWILIIN